MTTPTKPERSARVWPAPECPSGFYDVLIAGQAMARTLILVTRDRREFTRVLGLRVEDREGGGT